MIWMDVIKAVIDFSFKRNELNEKKKQKLSLLFLEISEVIEQAALDLQNNIYPHGKCEIMKILSSKLIDVLKEGVKEEDVKQLSNQLTVASNLELEYANRADVNTIITLHKTAGQFQAMSLIYKI